MNATAVAVVVLSPRQLRRRGLELALSTHPSVAVAGVSADVKAGSQIVRNTSAGGIVVDVETFDDEGLAELRGLHSVEDVSIVCFASKDHPRLSDVNEFAHVLEPREGIDLAIAALLDPSHAERAKSRRSSRRESIVLTPREREVLTALSRGRSAAETAAELGISAKTVDVHKRNLYAKLGVRSQSEAVAVALQRRMFEPEPPRNSYDRVAEIP
jgi:DNA-binding NarL/FixJ family response regulator